MTVSVKPPLTLRIICLLIISSGFASLCWEVIWQIKSTLALGISAWGTAVTLAVTMDGMGIGALLMGRALRAGSSIPAIAIYGMLEFFIGLFGLMLNMAFSCVERLDSWVYIELPDDVSMIHILSIVAVLGVPALCMGASLPVFGLIARQYQIPISKLYGLNTLGAAIGVLFTALVLIPLVGITRTIWIIAAINAVVCFAAWAMASGSQAIDVPSQAAPPKPAYLSSRFEESFIVFATGFATFALEVAWFRSLANAFPNSTDVFAVLLACMLVALGMSARNVPKLKQKNKPLYVQVVLAGILILLITPLIERFDIFFIWFENHIIAEDRTYLLNPDNFTFHWTAVFPYIYGLSRLSFLTAYFIIPPMLFLGAALPWVLDSQASARAIGKLYALNTLASIMGAVGAAWFLLPTIGFAKTAWIAGSLVVFAGILATPPQKRPAWAVAGIAALMVAMFFEAGIGKVRVQGYWANIERNPAKILGFYEGPEATTSAVEYKTGDRGLLIGSASASREAPEHEYNPNLHYIAWMGHLPMLLAPDPENALVICFGTGQTANAIRKENPQSLDIVDINPRVFKLAPYFHSNENVLHDPRVKKVVMDGRAYLRRTQKMYDVISLEPMPPSAVGVNNLYSREFYELASKRLSPKGVIAQWLPFHSVAPHSAVSIARTFAEAFPNAVLWIDPESTSDGILLGTKDASLDIARTWQGFARTHIKRDLTRKEVQQNIALNPEMLKRYGAYGEIITDDNQLLAYGGALYFYIGLIQKNFELLHRINDKIKMP